MISNNCTMFRWMEVYPEKIDTTLHAHDRCTVHFFRGIPRSIEKLYSLSLDKQLSYNIPMLL